MRDSTKTCPNQEHHKHEAGMHQRARSILGSHIKRFGSHLKWFHLTSKMTVWGLGPCAALGCHSTDHAKRSVALSLSGALNRWGRARLCGCRRSRRRQRRSPEASACSKRRDYSSYLNESATLVRNAT